MDYQELIDEVYDEVSSMKLKGKVADYIPQLADIDPDLFGLALVDLEGNIYGAGDYRKEFSIQSISKVLTLTMVMHVFKSKLWHRVNVEPSGNPFNSVAQLEYENGIPRNPFINAGALVIIDAMVSKFDDPEKDIIDFINEITGHKSVKVNELVHQSEIDHSDRNLALAHFLKAHGNFDNKIDRVLDVYTYACSLEMNCIDLARSFSFFANDGYCIFAKRRILSQSHTRRINALMLTCGFYDESGEFAFRVGLPGKSGVGGGVAAAMPGKFSVAAFSPQLNGKGNSLKAMKALELLTTKLKFSLF